MGRELCAGVLRACHHWSPRALLSSHVRDKAKRQNEQHAQRLLAWKQHQLLANAAQLKACGQV